MSQTTMNAPDRTSEVRQPPWRRIFAAVAGGLPTLAVFVALAAIAYWGHRNGWQVPRFAELTGADASESEAWCDVHNVLEEDCIECLPTLVPDQKDYGWCKEHGVHQCPLCHPEVAQLKTTPAISQRQLENAALALSVRHRQENNIGCTTYRTRVQFGSLDAVRKAGVDMELVETRPIVESIVSNGEITYDETRVAHLAARVPGTIWRVERNVGDRVRQGDVLALINAADVGKAKSELLDAMAEFDFHSTTVAQLTPAYDKQAITRSRMLEAETALQQASIRMRRAEQALVNLGLDVPVDVLQQLPESERIDRLRFLGLPDELRSLLADQTASNNLIPLIAPQDGVVTYREAVSGEVVDPSAMLFQLADTSRMWVKFNVALEDTGHLAVGQSVRFLPDGGRREVTGRLSWISTDVDPHTRTVAVRAEVDNSDGNLRNKTFGLGQIILRQVSDAVTVPSEAIQWDGSCHVVFVRDRDFFDKGHPKVFHTRSVRPGVSQDGFTEIIAGVLPGEVVVTKGSSVLRSQILKNNLGAGCACAH